MAAAASVNHPAEAAAPMVPNREGPSTEESLRSLLNVPSKSHYDNSAVRRRLSGHRRGSSHSADMEKFASKKHPFAFFNTADAQEDTVESVHPLFAALALGATQDVVYALYEACPKALGETTRAGLTPLHLACQYGASVKVVEFLLHHCPSHALRKSKGSWSTPLHAACASGATADVVRALVVKSHASLREKDRRGNTPLHCAALSRSSAPDVVRLLIAFRRSALEATNNMGMRPLHAACLSNSSPASIRAMVAKSPSGVEEAAGAADAHGNVALHYAGSHGPAASAEVVRLLLESDPAAAARANKLGHTPLDVAEFDAGTPAPVVAALESVRSLAGLSDDGAAAELHSSVLSQGWSAGADLILDARPGLVHRLGLDEAALPAAVRKFERRKPNNLAAVFELVKGMPHLVGR